MSWIRVHAGWLVASLLVLSTGAAQGGDPAPDPAPSYVVAEIYEVFHGDSLHRLGVHVREIHVPSRGLAFYVWQGELRVFRPEAHRYRLPGEKLVVEAPGGSPIEVPWISLPGCETQHVGSTRVAVADVDRFATLLEDSTRLRPVADGYLQAQARAWSFDRTRVPPAPPDVDVLHHLARFPGSDTVQTDGRSRKPKYGDSDLEQAETVLTGRVSRPWTVDALKKAYEEATEETVRAALIYLLAASRSPEVLPLVGAALSDESLDVRVKATYGILTYWDEEGIPEGGTEQAMDQAGAWWKARTP